MQNSASAISLPTLDSLPYHGISVSPVRLIHRERVLTRHGYAIVRTEWLPREYRYTTTVLINGNVYHVASVAGSYDAEVQHINWSDPWAIESLM
ncbi:hypothetical protein [Mycobacterium phage Azrael100]|uniref:Uncharacterized protein n=1 Tax=Mycobacterium phage Cosmo TaxID=1567467 RepID=A0A0B4ZXV1_9CAUD|nr:hypothetical protein COSMO_160 [Mycobacterium phage Cosmo]WKR36140.1 hypothetical protein [Mycobacterium phage Azrael100]